MTHIIASNLTPKKRVEFERYKVVRPEWIVDCVKAGKILAWNNYRLITQSSQRTIGLAQQVSVDGYMAVSSREEKVVLGGGGLKSASQETSSYPTPPEMKSLGLGSEDVDANEGPLDDLGEKMLVDELKDEKCQPAAAISLSKLSEPTFNDELELPSTLSSIHISSPSSEIHPRPRPETSPLQEPTNQLPQTTNESSPLDDPDTIPKDRGQVKSIPNEDMATISAAHNATILANPSLRPHTVVDPSFLKSYFDQSRLHHLSTWKADLKSQMQQLTALVPPRPRKLGPERWILHVDFDCFFCSVSLISRPELRDKPVCVGHGGVGSGEIASCNYPAREFGIWNGMLYVPLPPFSGVVLTFGEHGTGVGIV